MVLAYVQLAFGDASFSPAGDGAWDDTIDTDDFGLGIPKPCVLEILLENNQAGHNNLMGVREQGSALNRLIPVHEAEAGGEVHHSMLVQTDADGLFEAYSEDVSDTTHYIVGYFTGVTYTELDDNWVAADVAAQWTDIDVFTDYGVPKERVCEVACVNEAANTENDVGIRINGSAINRRISIHETEAESSSGYSTFVKTDADGVIEYWDANAFGLRYYLLGYFDDAVDFTERQDTLDAAGDAGWENENLIGYGVPASAVVAVICMNGEDGAENEMGVREDGTALDRKWDEHEAEDGGYTGFRLCVTAGADANRIIEIYEEDTSECILYHHGWFSDVGGVETFTKTFTFDALLQKNLTQEFTFDGLLQKEFTKTFTLDALLQKNLTKTFTFDAFLQKNLTKDFTLDAILILQNTKEFTLDGILILQKTKDFTFDAFLQKNLTKTFTLDGLLQKSFTKDFTFDALLGKTFTKEFTFDGQLILQKTKEFTLDALLQKNLTKTFTFDGLLQKEFTKTFTLDALLQKNLTKTFTFDALLQKNLTKTFTLDGLLQKSFTKTFTLDALLQKNLTQEFTFDALLQKNLTKDFTLDGLLQKNLTQTFTFDGLLLKHFTKTFTLDALLQKTLTKTFTFDAILDFVLPVEAEVLGGYPPLQRFHYVASMPMYVTIRRPVYASIRMNRIIRRAILASIDVKSLIRRLATEGVIAVKRPIITPKFIKLMKTIYEYLKEDA